MAAAPKAAAPDAHAALVESATGAKTNYIGWPLGSASRAVRQRDAGGAQTRRPRCTRRPGGIATGAKTNYICWPARLGEPRGETAKWRPRPKPPLQMHTPLRWNPRPERGRAALRGWRVTGPRLAVRSIGWPGRIGEPRGETARWRPLPEPYFRVRRCSYIRWPGGIRELRAVMPVRSEDEQHSEASTAIGCR